MIQHINNYRRLLAPAMALFLLLIAAAFLAGCGNDGSMPATERPQPTATSTSAPEPVEATPTDAAPATETATPSRPPLQVVATSNIVGDWAEAIGGDRVEVFSLLPPGGDPHNFVPGAKDVAKVADADIVLTIGLGLEQDWLEDLLHNASADDSKIVALGERVDPLEFAGDDHHDDHMDDHGNEDDHDDHEDDHDDHEDDHGNEDDHDDHEDDHGNEDDHGHEDDHGNEDDHDDHEDDHGNEDDHDDHEDDHGNEDDHDDHEDDHGHEDDHDDHMDAHGHEGHDHGPLDPHFWFDPNRVKVAVNVIAARLSALDPEGTEIYFQNATDYAAQLDELHAWTQEQVKLVPPERRLLVTSHDTFSYFAALYGFEVIGLIIPSLGTHLEPSAEHVAGVVEVVREHNAPAVFSENTVSAKLPQAVAGETGAKLVQLYTGSLGEKDSPGGTYLGMFRTNVERIVEALR